MRHRLASLTALACAGAALATAGPAVADHAPTPSEARQIKSAIRTTSLAGIDEVPRNQYVIRGIRVSTVSPWWATAVQAARPAFRSTFQGGYVVLVRTAPANEPGPWVVIDAGSSGVGCLIAPFRVLQDLRIGDCPAGDRI